MKDHYKYCKPTTELQKAEFIYYGGATFLRPHAFEFEAVHRKFKCSKRLCLYYPNSISMHSESLLDVLLTNTPEMFNKCGVYQPLFSDHYLIYGEMVEKVCKHKAQIIESRYT